MRDEEEDAGASVPVSNRYSGVCLACLPKSLFLFSLSLTIVFFAAVRLSSGVMSSFQQLQEAVNERLRAAAEEIFQAVKGTIVGLEDELLRSRLELERHQRLEQHKGSFLF